LLLFKKKDPAPEKDAYLAGDLCCFCQSDSACGTGPVDADSDGYFPPDDWNDNDAAVNPGATEVFTGATDDDCDNKLTKQLNHCQNAYQANRVFSRCLSSILSYYILD
jgi:hypothetical protein